MSRFYKQCLVCKTTYEFCQFCSRFDHLPRFMTTFCSQNCKDVFDTACAYEQGKMSQGEAKENLNNLDLSRRMYYTGSIATSVNKILGEDSKKETEEVVVEKEEDKATDIAKETVDDLAVEPTNKVSENNVMRSYNAKKHNKKNR